MTLIVSFGALVIVLLYSLLSGSSATVRRTAWVHAETC